MSDHTKPKLNEAHTHAPGHRHAPGHAPGPAVPPLDLLEQEPSRRLIRSRKTSAETHSAETHSDHWTKGMIIRPRVYPRSHDHCVSQQEPRLRPTRTVSSTHAPGTCPHMDTWQRDREVQEYTGLAVLGVLG